MTTTPIKRYSPCTPCKGNLWSSMAVLDEGEYCRYSDITALEARVKTLEEALTETHDYFAKRNIGEPAQMLQKKLAGLLRNP